MLKPGYRAFFQHEDINDGDQSIEREEADNEGEDQSLSAIPTGRYNTKVDRVWISEKETEPPSRYTQASLAEDMTRIAKYVDDPVIKKMLLAKDRDKKGYAY